MVNKIFIFQYYKEKSKQKKKKIKRINTQNKNSKIKVIYTIQKVLPILFQNKNSLKNKVFYNQQENYKNLQMRKAKKKKY